MTDTATGLFEVSLVPQSDGENPSVGRMTSSKQFHGDLEGTSEGQMLMASSAVPGSAGYVAIEKVTGTLKGRRGSFYLQHYGVMTRGAGELKVAVLPDSGTDQLSGLQGTMEIVITNGQHSYVFNYMLD